MINEENLKDLDLEFNFAFRHVKPKLGTSRRRILDTETGASGPVSR